MRHKLILAGGGSGTAEYLLPAAKKALEEVELVIASPRFLELLHARKTTVSYTHLTLPTTLGV